MKIKKRELFKQTSNNDDTVQKAIKIIAAVIAFFAVFFIATKLFNEGFGTSGEKVTYQREEILAGQTFTIQSSGEYMVVYYDFEDADMRKLATAVSTYKTKYNKYNVYLVNLGEGLNQVFYAVEDESSNYSKEGLKVKNPSLVRIKDNEIIHKLEGVENVSNYISGLTE